MDIKNKLAKVKQIFSMNKRGVFDQLSGAAKGIIGLVFLGTIGVVVVQALQATQTSNSLPYNIAGYGITSIGNMMTQLGTAGTLLGIGVIVFGGAFALYLLGAFGGRR